MKICKLIVYRWHLCVMGAAGLLGIAILSVRIIGYSANPDSSTYYVDATLGNDSWSGVVSNGDFIPTGCVINNDSSGCSDGPWKTLGKVGSSSYQTGDSIMLKRGESWNETLWLHSKADGMTLGAYGDSNDPKPEIVANGRYAVSLRNSSDWTIQDLKLRGGTGQAQLIVYAQTADMQNIRIYGLEIDGTNPNYGIGIEFINGDSGYHIENVEVAYCDIYDAGAPAATGNHDGIYIRNVRNGAHIHHNTISDSRGDGIDVTGGDNHVVEYNFIYRTTTFHGIKAHAQRYGLRNLVVRYNIIVDANDYGLCIQNSENGVITNNTAYKNDLTSWAGNHFGNLDGRLTSFTGNIVKNNILTGGNDAHGALYIENIPNIQLTNDITNNLYKSLDGANVVIVDTSMGPITYDSFDQLWLPFHSGSIAADPLFSNAVGGDYTLATGSPAINAGLPVGATVDILGNSVGSSPDMGACEYIFPDNDGDGHTSEFDCDDSAPSVFPGAPETKHDGIDQDCNGYDLTIEITTARMKGNTLYVTATSSFGASADLQVEGYGQMTWLGKKGYWTFSSKVGAGARPDTVTVTGIEGSETTPLAP